jgi:hypothetical protein
MPRAPLALVQRARGQSRERDLWVTARVLLGRICRAVSRRYEFMLFATYYWLRFGPSTDAITPVRLLFRWKSHVP